MPRSLRRLRRPFSAVARRPWIPVGALTAATALVATLRLADRSIWIDEGTSISYASRSWTGLWSAIGDDPNMSLYYTLLWGWVHALGDDVFVVRSLSVLFAALTVPAVYLVGARLFGVRAGFAAAVIVAANAFILRYAQEARGYTLVVLLVTVASWLFVRQLQQPDRLGRAGYVAAATLAVYAHYFAAYVLGAHVAALLILRGKRALEPAWLVQYGAVVVLCSPTVYATAALPGNPLFWLDAPRLSDLADAIRQIAGASYLLLAAALVIWLTALPRVLDSPVLRRQFVLPALWLVLPIALSFAVSQQRPMFLPRYLIVCVPAFALITAGALTSLRRKGALVTLLVAVVVLSGPSIRTWYRSPPLQDWKAVAEHVLDRAETGDGIVFDVVGFPAVYYARQTSSVELEHLAPDEDWDSLARADNRRIWVLVGEPGSPEEVRRALERGGFRLEHRRSFHEAFSVEAHVSDG